MSIENGGNKEHEYTPTDICPATQKDPGEYCRGGLCEL